MKYSIKIVKRICIKKDDKNFGRRMLIVHLLKDKLVFKWFYIFLWKVR